MKKNIIPIIILTVIGIFVIWFFVSFFSVTDTFTFRPVSGEIDEIQTAKNACRAYCNAAKVAIVSENEFIQSNYCARQFTIDNQSFNCWQPPANIECSFIIEENNQQKTLASENCQEAKEEVVWKIDSDNFVFIQHHISTDGKVIAGDSPPLAAIDFPSFIFNKTTGILEGYINFEINDTLKVIYGKGESLSGDAGTGASTHLVGVYKLPYEEKDLKIISVESNGEVDTEYKSQRIMLKSGEKWIDTSSIVVIKKNFEDEEYRINLTINDTIFNHGIWNKTKIIRLG